MVVPARNQFCHRSESFWSALSVLALAVDTKVRVARSGDRGGAGLVSLVRLQRSSRGTILPDRSECTEWRHAPACPTSTTLESLSNRKREKRNVHICPGRGSNPRRTRLSQECRGVNDIATASPSASSKSPASEPAVESRVGPLPGRGRARGRAKRPRSARITYASTRSRGADGRIHRHAGLGTHTHRPFVSGGHTTSPPGNS